jgi:hypothetical protein
MTVAFLARSAPIPREARCKPDFALRARADCVGKSATVIDRRYKASI